jgi:glycine/D-amino acid oxidase-like deaminating enzyme
MKKNHSPWLHQLRKDRSSEPLKQDSTTDIAIVGAGIAGISTAFFLLKNTDKQVILLDKFKLAHGATGHNAGQIVSYFERGFASLVQEFGLEKAAEGQKNIENAWELLDEIYTEAGLNIPLSRFLGHAGLSSHEQVELHLKNNLLRKQAGLPTERLLIADNAPFLNDLSADYAGLYEKVSHADVLTLLETKIPDYVAVLSYPKGCMNSALFCEEVALYLQGKYSDRFKLYEHTPVHKIILKDDHALLDCGQHTLTATEVILCTNGFANVTIINEHGLDIDVKFHHLIHGTVGYMSGYLETMNKPPVAISYLNEPDPNTNDPYFYLTRRLYEYELAKESNLISIGGPEESLEDSSVYSKDTEYPDEMVEMIDEFVKKTYDKDPNRKIDYEFTWHGLMGYTKNGVRLIGREPKNPRLLYNLGCNGVGILPSIFGGKRIARTISGESMDSSIFDIPETYEKNKP